MNYLREELFLEWKNKKRKESPELIVRKHVIENGAPTPLKNFFILEYTLFPFYINKESGLLVSSGDIAKIRGLRKSRLQIYLIVN